MRDLKDANDNDVPKIRGMKKILLLCRNAIAGTCPHETIDHTKTTNPYESKYGNDWKNNIKTTTSLSPFRCIADMLLHIVQESNEIFKGIQCMKMTGFSTMMHSR